MGSERVIHLWEMICECADGHSRRWSHLSAEDLASLAFLEVVAPGGELKPWVDEAMEEGAEFEDIARRVVNRVAKRQQRDAQKSKTGLPDRNTGGLGDLLDGLDADEREFAFERLQILLSELSDDQRLLLVAYYVEQRNLKEISEEFSLSPGAVANRLLRLRKRIIRCLEDEN